MMQDEGETFHEFLTRIITQSAKCNFKAVHDSLLRDRIIVGIKNDALREMLLADDESTLDRVTQRCRASELASKKLQGIQQDGSSINAVSRKHHQARPTSSKTFDCNRCGRSHGPKDCPAYKQRYKNCNKDGHFASMCKSKRNQHQQKSSKRLTQSTERTTATITILAQLVTKNHRAI